MLVWRNHSRKLTPLCPAEKYEYRVLLWLQCGLSYGSEIAATLEMKMAIHRGLRAFPFNTVTADQNIYKLGFCDRFDCL